MPVVVTAMWNSALATAMRFHRDPRFDCSTGSLVAIDAELSITSSRSTLGVDWSQASWTVLSGCAPAVRPTLYGVARVLAVTLSAATSSPGCGGWERTGSGTTPVRG